MPRHDETRETEPHGFSSDYHRGYQRGQLDGYTAGFDDGHKVGYRDGMRKRTGMRDLFVAGCVALVMVGLALAATLGVIAAAQHVAAETPQEKPAPQELQDQGVPPLGLSLDCKTPDVASEAAVKSGMTMARRFFEYINGMRSDRATDLVLKRAHLLGWHAGIVDAGGYPDYHKQYLVGYAVAVNRAFDGDLPAAVLEAYKRGLARGKQIVEEKDYRCVSA